MRIRPTIVQLSRDLGYAMVVAAGCIGSGLLLHWMHWVGWNTLAWIMALAVSLFAAIPISLLTTPWFMEKNRTAAPLLIFMWRSFVYATAALVASATNCPIRESFTYCLLGCYFPFLLLESWLAITRTATEPRT